MSPAESAGGFRSAVTGLPKMPPLASVGSAMSRMRTRSPPRLRCTRAASAASDSGPELMAYSDQRSSGRSDLEAFIEIAL